MARLELARLQAYHAADSDALDPTCLAQHLAAGSPVGDLQFRFHPSFVALRSQYAIHSLWAAHQGEGELSDIDPYRPEDMAVVRTDDEVFVVRLGAGDYEFITLLRAGVSIAHAVSAAECTVSAFDLSAALRRLLVHGALSGILLPELTGTCVEVTVVDGGSCDDTVPTHPRSNRNSCGARQPCSRTTTPCSRQLDLANPRFGLYSPELTLRRHRWQISSALGRHFRE